ncbi:Carboxylesterase 2 [Anaplasma phagocytophilum]|uniref:alpha/beta hydrolase n=1 Tax=Anaplasma phagocytophilum TaxID=948 RepID=UPI0007E041DD|nr:dienelactone hydrolase family protein [Anaplasma phagocytophilum]SCV63183.1 Carboxylesterase 2 [Anaplasma phagocytophilum]SCV63844.1 Carboxylesterase 2 [Anaplasma phagocytophilum]SCV64507.1 Carboxylesterase 2 [Anaplasma phagocytophilum]
MAAVAIIKAIMVLRGSMVVTLKGPCYCSGDSADSLVVMLHGRGASGDNMIAIAPYMSQKGLNNTQFVSPHAPLRYGSIGYTWFTDSLRDMEERSACAEIMKSVEMVNRFIDVQLEALGIGDDKLSLVGFSQGAMLSIYVGLSREKKCASVVAYSGAVPFPHALESMVRSRPDVCVIHGEDDDVIPFYFFEECVDFLQRNKVPVEAHSVKSLGHSIDDQGLETGSLFIKNRITGNAS